MYSRKLFEVGSTVFFLKGSGPIPSRSSCSVAFCCSARRRSCSRMVLFFRAFSNSSCGIGRVALLFALAAARADAIFVAAILSFASPSMTFGFMMILLLFAKTVTVFMRRNG